MPGQILGDRYEVEKQLGKKSGRWTLLARDLTTETPVILKLLFIDEETTPDDLKLFKREIDILKTLDHPATPKYLEYFEIELPNDGKALVLVESYLEGASLERYLQKGRQLSEGEAKQVAKTVLKILCYLHDRQPPIIHRDIKPSNILIANPVEDSPSPIYLVDFGTVRSLAPISSDYTSLTLTGTYGYMPPEQMGRRAVQASDLYSLGITLVTAISGIPPEQLPRQGLQIAIDQVLQVEPTFLAWLQCITASDLDQRFKSASEALAALTSPAHELA